ncbi:MAG: hypothetical protein JWN13_5099 [Betaproteobacteria bacterium]|jgi:Ca2+-binding EF-hand superfamily protein|nr:hypothetical protein [Betaproteobacteria bacterium]MEA3152616.1 hypothetical protein [Betaproteobacteria bacterium]
MTLTHIIASSASALCIALAGCANYSGQQSPGPSASAGPPADSGPRIDPRAGLRAQSGQTRKQVFDQLDANRDGNISRAEADASPELVAIFVTTDANSDDMLSLVEFAAVPISFGDAAAQTGSLQVQGGTTRQQVFDALDANHDGMISRAEADASPDLVAVFVSTDANSDSMLSPAEFALVPISFGGAAPQTGAVHAMRGMTRQQAFNWLDTNHDGTISRAEAQASPQLAAIFVATDANSDGMLTAVEFAAVPITFDGGTAVGGTGSMGSGTGSGMGGGSAGWWPVQTPSQPNETQPGMLNAISGSS